MQLLQSLCRNTTQKKPGPTIPLRIKMNLQRSKARIGRDSIILCLENWKHTMVIDENEWINRIVAVDFNPNQLVHVYFLSYVYWSYSVSDFSCRFERSGLLEMVFNNDCTFISFLSIWISNIIKSTLSNSTAERISI